MLASCKSVCSGSSLALGVPLPPSAGPVTERDACMVRAAPSFRPPRCYAKFLLVMVSGVRQGRRHAHRCWRLAHTLYAAGTLSTVAARVPGARHAILPTLLVCSSFSPQFRSWPSAMRSQRPWCCRQPRASSSPLGWEPREGGRAGLPCLAAPAWLRWSASQDLWQGGGPAPPAARVLRVPACRPQVIKPTCQSSRRTDRVAVPLPLLLRAAVRVGRAAVGDGVHPHGGQTRIENPCIKDQAAMPPAAAMTRSVGAAGAACSHAMPCCRAIDILHSHPTVCLGWRQPCPPQRRTPCGTALGTQPLGVQHPCPLAPPSPTPRRSGRLPPFQYSRR